jgi:phosphomannomutase/phosphoglucomutase
VELAAALQAGIRATGMSVIDIGMATTPLVHFATRLTETGTGVAVTGGHSSDRYNGFKVVLDGAVLDGAGLRDLHTRMQHQTPVVEGVAGARTQIAVANCYSVRLVSDMRLERSMKIAIDCGNGVTGAIAPDIFRAMGCDVTELSCEVNGAYPVAGHEAGDPHYLSELSASLRYTDCEVGIALDGDGGRLAVVSKTGAIIWPDRLMILFARDLLAQGSGGRVVYDVKSTRNLAREIRDAGGTPIMWKSGHAQIRAKMRESDALLAGDMCGRIYFRDRWYGISDAVYAAARMLEILSRYEHPSSVLDNLPQSCATPELRLETQDGEQFSVVDALRVQGRFMGAREIIDLDGVRVEYEDGFGLARPASAGAAVMLRFEADTGVALSRIQEDFRRQLLSVAPRLRLPF